jgi:hypothetical protein
MKEIITIIISITIPILTGLTYLAYKNPHAYKKLSLSSTWFKIGLLYLMAYFFWNLGLITAYEKLIPLLPENNTKEALNILNSINIPSYLLWFAIGVWFILWAYFWFLSTLPFLLKKEDERLDN